MKIAKWFRYGFLILGFLFICFLYLLMPGWLPLPFDEYTFVQFFVASALSFIAYAIVRIVELYKSENKFEPLVIYYVGFILSCIVYSNIATHSPTYYLLEQPLSGKLTPLDTVVISLVYFISTTLLLLIGAVWNFVKVCVRLRNDKQKLNSLSKSIWSVGTSLFWIHFIWFLFHALVSFNYIDFTNPILRVVYTITTMLLFVSIPVLIVSVVLRIIYIIKCIVDKKRSSIEIETPPVEVIEQQQTN